MLPYLTMYGKHATPVMCEPKKAPQNRNFVRCSIVYEVQVCCVNCLEATFPKHKQLLALFIKVGDTVVKLTSVGSSVEAKVKRSSLAASRPRIDNVSLLRIARFEGSNSASAAVIYVTLRFIFRAISRKKRARRWVERRCMKLCPSCSRDGGPGD